MAIIRLRKRKEDRMDAYTAYHNVFRCLYCSCIHGFTDPKKFPRVTPIQSQQRYLDCTAWWCPKCKRYHDSRQLGDTFLGVGGATTVTSVNPDQPSQEVRKTHDGKFMYAVDCRYGMYGSHGEHIFIEDFDE